VCVFVALFTQHAMCTCHVVICGLPAFIMFFCIMSKKGDFLGGKMLFNIKRWFSLQCLSETFLILRRNEWDMIKKCVDFHVKYPLFMSDFHVKYPLFMSDFHVKYPLFVSDFNETWIFSTDFRKHSNIKIMKIRPVGAELFCAERPTDRPTWRS
jgi:hypothetical protein